VEDCRDGIYKTKRKQAKPMMPQGYFLHEFNLTEEKHK
jgi:hypothetical protein